MHRFNGVCLITNDVPALSGFYRDLLRAEVQGDAQFAQLQTAGAALTFFDSQAMQQMAAGSAAPGPGGVVLEFQVEDVDLLYQKLLEQAVEIVKAPTTQPWGLRSVWFRDPDGNLVNLFAPVAAGVQFPAGAVEAGVVVREYFQRVVNEKDLSACDALLAADYVDHDAPPDTPPGPASIKAYLAQLFQEYPNMHVTIVDLVAEGNRAAARLEWRATHSQTGAPYDLSGMLMLRLDDQGRLAERWSVYEQNL
jgi:uncharacterized glyoxalase superfamily protein PhnB/predicted SnoaL-like aldol condensation-catalyzing enzyme